MREALPCSQGTPWAPWWQRMDESVTLFPWEITAVKRDKPTDH